MIKVAITGNIASGKSCVETYLKEAGYKVVDSDSLGHTVLEEEAETIIELFKNDDIVDSFGKISREKLGKIVFSDSDKKRKLEEFSHKKITQKLERFFSDNESEQIVFVSAALLFEAKIESLFDKIIFVSAPEQLRLERLIARNGYDAEYAKKRIESQENEENKIKKSDFVIYNNSDFNNLISQTTQCLDILSSLV